MIRVGTRGSALALAQARWVGERLGSPYELVTVTTLGDRGAAVGDKSRWVSALEQALLADEIDVAVHSAKDVPAEIADGLELVAFTARADPRDAICGASSLATLAPGARVGTSSLRRAAQIRAIREDVLVVEVRGNVDTRLRKLAAGDCDALIVAAAGLERLERMDAADGILDELVPAAGQGALALEARAGRVPVDAVADEDSTACVLAERELTRVLGASCNTPVGALARVLDGELDLIAWAGRADGSAWVSDRLSGPGSGLGARVAERMLSCGAAELLRDGAAVVTVYLVGAGPGDPGLMTARALELIAAADVIVYDRLIPASALDGVREDAELVYAGKEGGGESVSQDEITSLLVARGSSGATVVRLKGGDPFVFGRGGEEAEALQAAGVPFEVVPGVTAGVAGPAYAGIPVTHRDAASAVAFVTGHEDPGKPSSAIDWEALAAFPGTLVIYMGVRQLGAIAEQLTDCGRDPSEPAAVIERGTLPGQRVAVGTLGTIAGVAIADGVRAPAVVVVGDVVRLHERLDWWAATRPLAGTTVAVTRARAQASGLAAQLRGLGAEVVEAPAIRIVPLDGTTASLDGYDLVCFTSPNGVRVLFDRLSAAGLDARVLAGARVAAIGPGTAAALRSFGVVADVVPSERFVAEGLVDALADVPVSRALVARAAEARDVLVDALRARGASVDVVALYETVAEPLSDEQVGAVIGADYVTFTSSSTVRFLLSALRDRGRPAGRLVSIGPVTSGALREHGLEPDVEAARHDIDGLVEALLADARSGE